MLELINICPKHAYKQYFNVSFPDFGVIYLKGPVGSFKTTLLNIIAGLNKNYKGTIINDKKISLACQDFCLVNRLSVIDNLKMQYILDGAYTIEVEQLIFEILDLVGLKDLKDAKVSNLSTGQKQRVAIANVLVSDADVLLFDEPTANLDNDLAKKLLKHIKTIAQNKLVILVSHDEKSAQNIADKVIKISSIITEEPQSKVMHVKKAPKNLVKLKYITSYFKVLNTIRMNIFLMLGAIFISLSIMFLASYISNLINPQDDKFHSTDPYFSYVSRVDANSLIKDALYIPQLESSATLVNAGLFQLCDAAQLYYCHKDIQLKYGRIPEDDNEVIISSGIWHNLAEIHNSLLIFGIRNIFDLIGEQINLGGQNEKKYKIVGIANAKYEAIYLMDQKAVYQHQYCFVNTTYDEQSIYFNSFVKLSSIRYIIAKYKNLEYVLPKSLLSENENGELYVHISELANFSYDMLKETTFSLYDENHDINGYFVKNMKNLIYHATYNMSVVDQIAKEMHVLKGNITAKITGVVFVIIMSVILVQVFNMSKIDFMLVGRCKLYGASVLKLNFILSQRLYAILAMIGIYTSTLIILTKNTSSIGKIAFLLVFMIIFLSFCLNMLAKKYLLDDCRLIFKKDTSYQ